MKTILIAFHLFMVVIYIGMGGILIFTNHFSVISGIARPLLGAVLIIYACFRGYATYRRLTQDGNGV